MNWKKWKIGAVVAGITGLLKGVVGLTIGLTWNQVGILLAVGLATDLLLFLRQHPVENVSFDTETISEPMSRRQELPKQ